VVCFAQGISRRRQSEVSLVIMVLITLALVAVSAAAQTAPDARALLQEVADAAQATKTWQVEGEIVFEARSDFSSNPSRKPFKLFKDGQRIRYEVSGPGAQTMIFDGGILWDYTPYDHAFSRRGAASGWMPVALYSSVVGLLPYATPAGRDRVGSQACDVVRVEAPRTLRTLCIDHKRKLVLRDRMETLSPPGVGGQVRTVQTITYLTIQRDIPIDAALFRFEPPPGATERPGVQVGSGVLHVGGGVTPLVLLSKTEPVYSEEARGAGVEGTVVLYIEVGPDGTATNIQVQRALGYGLDEKAIEAMRQWRFRPGVKDGQPVTAAATIEVTFRRFPPPSR